jgi:hypothetical protein
VEDGTLVGIVSEADLLAKQEYPRVTPASSSGCSIPPTSPKPRLRRPMT